MSLTTSLDGFSSSVTEIKILERPLTQSVTLSLSPLLEGEEKDHTEEEGITQPLPPVHVTLSSIFYHAHVTLSSIFYHSFNLHIQLA